MHSSALNDRSTPLRLLASRRSGKARDLVAPAPSAAERAQMFTAASRVPDHGKLAPWRYVVVEDRTRFGEEMVRLYRAQKPDAGRLELESIAAAAQQAPLLVIALFAPRTDSHIPLWEQELSMGASIMALILAAHALGYAANWLTGPAASVAGLADLLGHPGARTAGFIHIGMPAKALEERPRPELDAIVSRF